MFVVYQPPPIVVDPQPAPPVFDTGMPMQITLSRGDHELTLLRRNGIGVLRGSTGWDVPDVRAKLRLPGFWNGGYVDGVSYGPREIFIPVLARAPQTELTSLLQRLSELVDPTQGEVTITVAHRSGTKRVTSGVYLDGFNGALGSGEGQWRRRFFLKFWCGDSYFHDAESITYAFGNVDSPGTFLGDPFLPLKIGSSQTLGEVTARNSGNAEAYPSWQITGPADSAEFINNTTGRSFEFGAIAEGETIFVDAGRGVQTAINNEDEDCWPRLSTTSELWSLAPGDNSINLALTGTDSATKVQLTYTPRFLTAWG